MNKLHVSKSPVQLYLVMGLLASWALHPPLELDSTFLALRLLPTHTLIQGTFLGGIFFITGEFHALVVAAAGAAATSSMA